MGMLMHHTWLEQQKEQEKKPEKPVIEPKEEETAETEPKRTGGRRKTK